MKAQIITAPSNEIAFYRYRLFLGGGISGCPDWHTPTIETLKHLPITIYNPRRENFDVSKQDDSTIQIEWEYKNLRNATGVMLWFPKETLCPITLFELGATLERYKFMEQIHPQMTQDVWIACEPEYKRIFDVRKQTSLVRPQFCWNTRLEGLVEDIVKHYEKFLGLTKS